MEFIKLSLPLDREQLRTLRAGDACLLSGPMYTLRDAGHVRLLEEMKAARAEAGVAAAENAGAADFAQAKRAEDAAAARAAEAAEAAEAMRAAGAAGATESAEETIEPPLPYGLAGQTIFYAGPTPSAAGRPFGAIGPTTASRMDFAACDLYHAGVAATLGKGVRSEAVRNACRDTSSVYFVACGGAAAYLARCVESSEIISYDDLGTEALRRIEVADFPVFVGIDVLGNDMYSL